jgi:hypothetical protein
VQLGAKQPQLVTITVVVPACDVEARARVLRDDRQTAVGPRGERTRAQADRRVERLCALVEQIRGQMSRVPPADRCALAQRIRCTEAL